MGADGGSSAVFVCNLCGAQCTAQDRPEWDQVGHVLGVFECSRCAEISPPAVKGDAERGDNKPVPERAEDPWAATWLPEAVRAGAWVDELPAPGRLSKDEPEVEEAEPAPEPEMWEEPSSLPPWSRPPPAATARGTKRKVAAHGPADAQLVTPAAPASARVQDRRRRPAQNVPLRLDLKSLSYDGVGPEQPVELGSPIASPIRDQRACKSCQRAKSSCSFTAAEPGPPGAKCSRCERLGIACVPNAPRHRACRGCRDAKEKCRWGADPERCLRCARLGMPCVRPSGPNRAMRRTASAPELFEWDPS